jgi:hypothetical protein
MYHHLSVSLSVYHACIWRSLTPWVVVFLAGRRASCGARCSILASVPDRQRTLRELQLNRTLFPPPPQWKQQASAVGGAGVATGAGPAAAATSAEGWCIKHAAGDYKVRQAGKNIRAVPSSIPGREKMELRSEQDRERVQGHGPTGRPRDIVLITRYVLLSCAQTGKDYGERPPLMIAPALSPALHEWSERWRQELAPQHDFFFTQKVWYGRKMYSQFLAGGPWLTLVGCTQNGKPLTDQALYSLFSSAAYRCTGKKTNPHLVRQNFTCVTLLDATDAHPDVRCVT